MIEIAHLSKSYGSKVVLNDISFKAENGFVTGFVGPNGAGKTTTMRIVAGLEDADSGEALVDGQHFSRCNAPSATMGVYLGSDCLPLNMSGKNYLSYICRVGNISEEKIDSVLELVALHRDGDKLIKSYSLGMKQRIGLAAAIIGDPTTLMLDEPVNGLDPMGVRWLRDMLRSQAQRGKAVLLSSHLLSELDLVADNVVMLNGGKIVAQGVMGDLESGSASDVHINTNDNREFANILEKKSFTYTIGDDFILVRDAKPEEIGKLAYDNGLLLNYLESSKQTLEEVFLNKSQAEQRGDLHE